MSREVERDTCAWCHDEQRPRSGLRWLRTAAGRVLICQDPEACYRRFRAWMIRQGRWAEIDGKLYPRECSHPVPG